MALFNSSLMRCLPCPLNPLIFFSYVWFEHSRTFLAANVHHNLPSGIFVLHTASPHFWHQALIPTEHCLKSSLKSYIHGPAKDDESYSSIRAKIMVYIFR